MPARAPLSVAERSRRYRERRRRGACVVPVELCEQHIDMLVASGWLHEGDASDPKTCAAAIERVLNAMSKNPPRVASKPSEPD